ncbi:MAG: LamG-like jellyroll fold domain-containing protein [Limisphaerales bacterium]
MKPLRLLLSLGLAAAFISNTASAGLRVGAVILDVSPIEFPVFVNGGMTSRKASEVNDPINARAIVLADGKTEIAIVVVDSCMMPRPVLDQAKMLAFKRHGIATNHILVSATHTHTAPASMGCLGTPQDPRYTPYLIQKIAEAIGLAKKKLQPAKAGWNTRNAAEFTALRRWINRPDKILEDPFGNPTGRANMHTGRVWENVTGESGPEDPDLNLISFQTLDGKPLALLANFSMHYFSGVRALSADYFGRFCNNLQTKLGAGDQFVGIMSHGCSGDIWRRDYSARDWSKNPVPREEDFTVDSYADQLSDRALEGYRRIKHLHDLDLAMAETRMTLNYRTPDAQRLQWAQQIVDEVKQREDPMPKKRHEVYAFEQVILHERQQTEICLQGLRIGDMVITTTPNETYALTALKLKAMSPLKKTMVIELANGGDGYIPPPEQHFLGGYNTWAARSAGLEVQAEPKITEACLQLLEKVSGKHRRPHSPYTGPAARNILAANPAAYWRMDEFAGPRAVDSSGNDRDGQYENGVVFHLEGTDSKAFNGAAELNRAAHFCGGRLRTRISSLKNDYTVAGWIWNGMPDGARDVAGWIFSRERDHAVGPNGDHLGLQGDGKLVVRRGDGRTKSGSISIKRWTWTHVAFVRSGDKITVYADGKKDIELNATAGFPDKFDRVFIGGRSDNINNWEGRLDEVAIFNRPLSPAEISKLTN